MNVAILAHEKFPERAKTAVGILRYGDYTVKAVIDRDLAGDTVNDHLKDVPNAPIMSGMAEIEDVEALIIGIAPIGGGFDESWREDIRIALNNGCDLISGLHYFLNEDEEFRELAIEHDASIWDVRKPRADLTVSQGIADTVDAEIILTVGTDCSVGKMTATLEVVHAARDAGINAGFIPTGQTGIMIDGWGNPIDRVISDFTAGAVEEMILERGSEYDYLFVEGQGSIVHPAYSGVTCGILHGAMADKLVLCHTHGRTDVHGYEKFSLPPMAAYVRLYEDLSAPVRKASVVAGMLNTSAIDDPDAAEAAVSDFSSDIGAPATDPVRFDATDVLEALL